MESTRSRHHLEPVVDADEELGRKNGALDRAELRAFDLPRDRAELARGINLRLDPAAGVFLDRGGVVLGELVGRIVQGRKRYLHHKGLVVSCPCDAGHERQPDDECTLGGDHSHCDRSLHGVFH